MPGPETSLETLRELFGSFGVRQILVKELAKNDNSKNQPYLGGNFEVVNLLPIGPVRENETEKGLRCLKAALPLDWIRDDGSLTPAPHAQVILYPQYPEVRLSGFLRGTDGGPNALMTSRMDGRLLFLGVTDKRRIVGRVVGPGSRIAKELGSLESLARSGVFGVLDIEKSGSARDRLLKALGNVYHEGWLEPQRLDRHGTVVRCNGRNCGGYTLEARLGIIPNARAEPDFEGYEVKAFSVRSFDRLASGRLTLMTPEPTAGFYKEEGAAEFVRRYGYPDKSGIADRLNFSSPHNFGIKNKTTGLTLSLLGYDREKRRITDPFGGFALLDEAGNAAAVWNFSGLIEHWNRKHNRAAYVPYRLNPTTGKFAYSGKISVGEGTDFNRFLDALSAGLVNYDPGIKLEDATKVIGRVKARSQLRIGTKNLPALYTTFETFSVQ